jgi:hypothetical protein
MKFERALQTKDAPREHEVDEARRKRKETIEKKRRQRRGVRP